MLLESYTVNNHSGERLAQVSLYSLNINGETSYTVSEWYTEYYDDMYGGSHSYIESDEFDFEDLTKALNFFNREKSFLKEMY